MASISFKKIFFYFVTGVCLILGTARTIYSSTEVLKNVGLFGGSPDEILLLAVWNLITGGGLLISALFCFKKREWARKFIIILTTIDIVQFLISTIIDLPDINKNIERTYASNELFRSAPFPILEFLIYGSIFGILFISLLIIYYYTRSPVIGMFDKGSVEIETQQDARLCENHLRSKLYC